MIRVWASRHPFKDDWVEAEVEGNQTIRQIVGEGVPVAAWIDGHPVEAEFIEKARIKDGVEIVVRPMPKDDGTIRNVAFVVVAIVATWISGGAAAPYIGATLGSGTGALITGAAVALAGAWAINQLIPPPKIEEDGRAGSLGRINSLTGAGNKIAAFEPIPRVYGSIRYFPPIPMTAKPYTEIAGRDQYLRMFLVLGYGPLEIGGNIVGEGYPKLQSYAVPLEEVFDDDVDWNSGTLVNVIASGDSLVLDTDGNGDHYSSGTWTSPTITFPSSDVQTIKSSLLTWIENVSSNNPVDSSVLVETSIDGGSSYQEASEGNPIPGVFQGDNVSSFSLIIRITLSAGQDSVGNTLGCSVDKFSVDLVSLYLSSTISGFPIEIGETDIHDFDEVEYEIGTHDQMTLYVEPIIEIAPGWETTNEASDDADPATAPRWYTDGGVTATRTTSTGCTEISIDITATLFSINSKGDPTNAAIDWKVEYKLTGSGDPWTVHMNPWRTSSNRKEPSRFNLRWSVPKGQYDVRLTRIRTYHNDFEAAYDDATWTALRTIRGNKVPFNVDGMVCMTLRIKASKQLSGRLDNLSVNPTSVLPVFNSVNATSGRELVNGADLSLPGQTWQYKGPNASLVGALTLDGSQSGTVSTPSALAMAAAQSFTVEGWFVADPSMEGGGSFNGLFSKGVSASPGTYSLYINHNTGALRFNLTDDADADVASETALTGSVCDDLPHHFALVIDRSVDEARLYLDGGEEVTVNISALGAFSDVSGLVYVGVRGSAYWLGEITDLRVWKEARSQAQIQANLGARLAGDETNLVAYWPLDIYDAWSGVEPTRTQAWIYADIFSGSANRNPADKKDINADDMVNWAARTEGDSEYFDRVIDSEGTTLDVVREVVANGRAAWAINPDNTISVIEDGQSQQPKMVISPRNVSSFSYETSAIRIPEALRVRFVDRVSWEDTERLVFDDGYDLSNARLYESINAPGVTDPDHAWKFGRFYLAQERLRPERYTFEQDVQHLRYQRGQEVTLQHDVIQVGIAAGRVLSFTTDAGGDVDTITSDEFLTMPDSGETYGIKVQKKDGSIVVVDLVTSVPGGNTVTLATPEPGIDVDDHFLFGISGKISIDVKVTNIESLGGLKARVTCAPAAPNILDALTGEIPAFDPVLTEPIDPDDVELPVPTASSVRIQSDESVLIKDPDGSLRARMVIDYDPPSFPGWNATWQVRYRENIAGNPSPSSWILSEAVDSDTISLSNVSENVQYEVQIRCIRRDRAGRWSDPIFHTVVGKTTPPPDVSGFQVLAARDRVGLSWAAVTVSDIFGYEIREGVDWDSGALVATDVSSTEFQTRKPSNGPWWIKAIDTSGNYSTNATQATLNVTLPSVSNVRQQVVDNNVLLRWSASVGTFDIDTYEIRKGPTLATAEVFGVSDTTFKALFELQGGEFTYWVVPIDAAGNEGTAAFVVAIVDEPPDFVLSNQFQTDWEGNDNSTNIERIQSAPTPARLVTVDKSGLNFDGVDDYVALLNSLQGAGRTALTLEAWIYTSSDGYIISYDRSEFFRLEVLNGVLAASVNTDTGVLDIAGSIVVARSRWMHVAFVYDAGSATLYVNGEVDATDTRGSTWGSATERFGFIGTDSEAAVYNGNRSGAAPITGRMSEVRVWDGVARTQTQIQDQMNHVLNGDETGLFGYWRMQAASDNLTITDKSGNGNNGDIFGCTWYRPQVQSIALFPVASTPSSRDGEGYLTPQDLIDAGHTGPALPALSSAHYEEVYDAGTVISSTRIRTTISTQSTVGSPTTTITISTKENLGDAWTTFPAGESEVYATQFRYVRVEVDFSGDGSEYVVLQDIETVLSTKVKSDGGTVTVSANPTTVSFNESFADVQNITATPQGTESLDVVVDFADVPNPTSFDLYMYDNTGNPATGTARWDARGV